MSLGHILLGIVGVGLLMVIHEAGHYFPARYFGMRVSTFSIGFGPTLWRHQPEGSPTVFQIGIIPFLAYVRIEGMNPYEESEPDDPGSYANASLWARIVTIAGGPAANYFFASVLIFLGLVLGGERDYDGTSMRIAVDPDSPAAQAGLRDGDRVVSIAGTPVGSWKELSAQVGSHPGETIDIGVERDGQQLVLPTTPIAEGPNAGKIMVRQPSVLRPVPVGEALLTSVEAPPKVVYMLVRELGRLITRETSPNVTGPLGIVREVSAAVKLGPSDALRMLGSLSAYLGAFNLLPLPALDGGRLIFLFYQVVARRKVDAKAEAHVHAIGLLLFLGLMAVVMVKDVRDLFSPN